MDTYEGAARLEWWANEDTCLCSVNVRVAIVSDDSGWRVSATFTSPLTGEEREGWRFLLALSPYWTLRFHDDEDASIDVRVEEPTEGELTLSAA
ncbi:hypothetical protein [Actinomadura bangladeshensis]|uniref:Uncharacterized protein n=1 Tax=Actinomadura bangladeshensis TaxID=453573 RepID=A0A4R4P8Z8_9ACTN|nr:hypothetical protein [Actinomadura bangladeshensis]TDC16712.1 hypothetical protein E1284_11735 [Actinomadura bangladeshensis]